MTAMTHRVMRRDHHPRGVARRLVVPPMTVRHRGSGAAVPRVGVRGCVPAGMTWRFDAGNAHVGGL